MIHRHPPLGTRIRGLLLAGFAIPLLVAAAQAPATYPPPPPYDPATATSNPPEHPMTNQPVTATDVATTPLSDLNIKKQGIPELLLVAEEHPYDLAGLNTCPRLSRAVTQLNAILGDDIDVQAERGNGLTAGNVAKSVVASFIPFRGIIRELSGANSQDRKVQAAIYAGTARRAFLKGVGLSRNCHYPARPYTSSKR